MKNNKDFGVLFSIARKNTFRQPRRSILLGGAIAFSVLIISLAIGFTTGMEKAVQNNVTIFSAGHILINGYVSSESGRAQNRISDQSLVDAVKKDVPSALGVSTTAQAQATVVFGSREQQLRVRGVDWNTDKLFSSSLILTKGDWQTAKSDRFIILGAQSAKRFGLGLGDSVMVRLSTFSGQQNVTEYKLGAIYDDVSAGGMNTALVPLRDLQQDLNLPQGEFQTVSVFLPDAAKADSIAAVLGKELKTQGYILFTTSQARQVAQAAQAGQGTQAAQARTSAQQGTRKAQTQTAQSNQATQPVQAQSPQAGQGGFSGSANYGNGGAMGGFRQNSMNIPAGKTVYRISTISELSGQVGAVLGSVRWIGIAIFVIMLMLTATGITNTYRMVLLERTKEIGMMRCIGFHKFQIFYVFLFESAILALAGSIAGILLSFPLGLIIHAIPFDASGSLGEALSRGRLLYTPTIGSLVVIVLSVLAASLLAVYWPAKKASELQPVEAIRITA
jgi:ABC-type lipoprotein release transport system permease subunit